MNTSVVLNQSAVASFDKELENITLYWQKIAAPFNMSISAFVDIKNSFAELIASQNKTYGQLNDFGLILDSMSFSDDTTMHSDTYAALRHLNDTLEEYYGFCRDMHTNFSEYGQGSSRWWKIIYFLSSRQAYKTRKKLMKAVKRQNSKIADILRKVDMAIATSPSKFVTLDADTLWQNRCKAYDYFI